MEAASFFAIGFRGEKDTADSRISFKK